MRPNVEYLPSAQRYLAVSYAGCILCMKNFWKNSVFFFFLSNGPFQLCECLKGSTNTFYVSVFVQDPVRHQHQRCPGMISFDVLHVFLFNCTSRSFFYFLFVVTVSVGLLQVSFKRNIKMVTKICRRLWTGSTVRLRRHRIITYWSINIDLLRFFFLFLLLLLS